MPTFEEIISRAEALGYPITEFAFKGTSKDPVPDPPFIVYLRTVRASGSDDLNRVEEVDGSIELYTSRKPDKAIEARIEAEVLYDTPYQKDQAEIRSENTVQTAYDFTIIQKQKR